MHSVTYIQGCSLQPSSASLWKSLRKRSRLLLHGLAPPSYLNDVVRVADLSGRRRLRSSSSHQLLVPPFRLTTVTRRTIPVAASLLCNSLTSDIRSSPSLHVLRQHTKHSFYQSFPNIVLLRLCWLRNSSAILATLKCFDWHWHCQTYFCFVLPSGNLSEYVTLRNLKRALWWGV